MNNIESTQEQTVESTGVESEVYKYSGGDEEQDIVAAVKSHHAKKHDRSPSDLIGRKIAEGGNDPHLTYVVIVEWS